MSKFYDATAFLSPYIQMVLQRTILEVWQYYVHMADCVHHNVCISSQRRVVHLDHICVIN